MAKNEAQMVLESVQTTVAITVFGNTTNKFSATMVNLSLRYESGDVIVTSSQHPGQEERIHKAAIAKSTWKAAK